MEILYPPTQLDCDMVVHYIQTPSTPRLVDIVTIGTGAVGVRYLDRKTTLGNIPPSAAQTNAMLFRALGLSNKQAGDYLSAKDTTINNYCKAFYRRMGAENAPHAISLAFGRGIFSVVRPIVTLPFTPRELDLMVQSIQGNTAEATGETLHLTEGTVKDYRSHLYQKLGTTGIEQTVLLAHLSGQLPSAHE